MSLQHNHSVYEIEAINKFTWSGDFTEEYGEEYRVVLIFPCGCAGTGFGNSLSAAIHAAQNNPQPPLGWRESWKDT